VVITSVSAREVAGTTFAAFAHSLGAIPEIGVWGESSYGHAVYASETDGDRLERALRIVSNGSFPPAG
jgi:hypothetical protein